MAIPTALAGMTVDPLVHEIDERWLMAYAAGLGLDDPCYLDTTRAGGIVAHPLFPVCIEWPAIVASRARSEEVGVDPAEVVTSVHATHDVTLHRPIRPGDRLTTTLEVVGVVARSPGALSHTRLRTVDDHGRPVATTTQAGIYLGVGTEGPDHPDPAPPGPVAGMDRRGEPTETAVPVSAVAAHVYTECARIWNPIHTDPVVARAAGLPAIILHGTANLAHGVDAVVAGPAGGAPERVRRIVGRFSAMVLLPSTLTVRVWPANPVAGDDGGPGTLVVPFEVGNGEGAVAVSDGAVVLDDTRAYASQ
ncbi:MAG: MaoC/PaaZ C-terminal domain-containing protein [Acidimicrobiales bacterium]